MKIIFIMLTKADMSQKGNIYTDLIKELYLRGNELFVVSANERRLNLKTTYEKKDGIKLLSVKTGNIQKTKMIEKGLSTILIQHQYKQAIKKYLKNEKFDAIVYVTPPISIGRLVIYLKNKYKCKTYLVLKDIFPENAVDLGILKRKSLLYKYFRRKEKILYRISDYIGCMSNENKSYVKSHNRYIDNNKIEVCPNSISVGDKLYYEKKALREKLKIDKGKFVLIYGGNLGKPQGINFLIKVIENNKSNNKVFIIIIGSGTEERKIYDYIKENNIENVKMCKYLPKEQYNQYVMLSDVGLIFLDKNFTIPNFPSRLLTYMEYGLPVIAATDKNTDIRECIRAGGFGEWCESGDVKAFNKIINKMIYDKQLLKDMGKNSRKSLERNFDVKISANRILSHFNNV